MDAGRIPATIKARAEQIEAPYVVLLHPPDSEAEEPVPHGLSALIPVVEHHGEELNVSLPDDLAKALLPTRAKLLSQSPRGHPQQCDQSPLHSTGP